MQSLPEIEQERQGEQGRLDHLRGMAERNRAGQFATPPALALDIAEYARSLRDGSAEQLRFLEPCIGTGAFYSALLQTFGAKKIERAAGYEIDADYLSVARSLWQEASLELHHGDFTRQAPPDQRFNLLITNPPYVRH